MCCALTDFTCTCAVLTYESIIVTPYRTDSLKNRVCPTIQISSIPQILKTTDLLVTFLVLGIFLHYNDRTFAFAEALNATSFFTK